MRKTKFTEIIIIKDNQEVEGDRSIVDISRELGINQHTFNNMNKKYFTIMGLNNSTSSITK